MTLRSTVTYLRFSIRDLLWAMLTLAFAFGWWAEHRRSDQHVGRIKVLENDARSAANRIKGMQQLTMLERQERDALLRSVESTRGNPITISRDIANNVVLLDVVPGSNVAGDDELLRVQARQATLNYLEPHGTTDLAEDFQLGRVDLLPGDDLLVFGTAQKKVQVFATYRFAKEENGSNLIINQLWIDSKKVEPQAE
jgi:hypothetical protein